MANLNNLKRLRLHGASLPEKFDTALFDIVLADDSRIQIPRAHVWLESQKFTCETENLADPTGREFEEDDDSNLLAIRSLIPVARLANVIAHTNANRRLSEVGKREKIEEVVAPTIKAIADQHVILQARAADIARRESTLFNVPDLNPGDARGELRDQEKRALFRSLRGDSRLRALTDIVGGRRPDMTAALLRDSESLEPHIRRSLTSRWRSMIEEQYPETVAAWQSAAAHHRWAHRVTAAAADHVRQQAKLDPRLISRAAGSVDGALAFGVPPIIAHHALASK